MWNLTRHFTFGYLTGGVVVSIIESFLLHRRDYAFWQLSLGYMATACLTGAVFGGSARVVGYPQGSGTNGRVALLSGAGCVFIEFAISTASHSFELGRVMLFALPVGAAFVYTVFARREWRRRMLSGVSPELLQEAEHAETMPALPPTD